MRAGFFGVFLAICGWTTNGFTGEISSVAQSVSSNVVTFRSPSDNTLPHTTNTLAFYVGDYGYVPAAGGGVTYRFIWNSEPILSDRDFAGWDEMNHLLLITSKAAKRVYSRFGNRTRPTSFGVFADGQPVCRGSFHCITSSIGTAGPEIAPDLIPIELNVTPDQWRHLQSVSRNQQGHLISLSTNEILDFMEHSVPATNDVALMPSPFDDRVAAAVKKLLANRTH
jgi:hypothetical protein